MIHIYQRAFNFLKMTNNITLLILALVIGLTGYSIYQMHSDLHDLKQDIMSVGDEVKEPPKEP